MTTLAHELDVRWDELLNRLGTLLGKRPADLNGVLFLIGVQELGQGPRRFSKEQKQDLMHLGICRVLSESGYYVLSEVDADGWPHYALAKPVPHQDLLGQEQFLKEHVLRYFAELF